MLQNTPDRRSRISPIGVDPHASWRGRYTCPHVAEMGGVSTRFWAVFRPQIHLGLLSKFSRRSYIRIQGLKWIDGVVLAHAEGVVVFSPPSHGDGLFLCLLPRANPVVTPFIRNYPSFSPSYPTPQRGRGASPVWAIEFGETILSGVSVERFTSRTIFMWNYFGKETRVAICYLTLYISG